jgi:hypothetical protein
MKWPARWAICAALSGERGKAYTIPRIFATA